ncbi:unnamed protein product, partial [marine sediment metagenome]
MYYHRVNDENDQFFHAVNIENFERQIRYLIKRYTIINLEDVVDHIKRGTRLPKNPIVITYDDGYKDNYLNAFPILRKYNAPATIFLTVGCIGTGIIPWTEKIHYILNNTIITKIELFNDSLCIYTLDNPEEMNRVSEEIKSYLKTMDEKKRNSLIEKLGDELEVPIGDIRDHNLMLSWQEVEEMAGNKISFGAHTVTHPILTRIPYNQAIDEIVASRKEIKE